MNHINKSQICCESYSRLKNLKLVEKETSIPWQTVYWYLKKSGVHVVGDKSIYGSKKDRFACVGEMTFNKIIPYAENQNLLSFQPKIDFLVNGYGIEVKSAKFTNNDKNKRWAFSLKKQRKVADFFILLAFDQEGKEVQYIFLLPNEIVRKELQTISISQNIGSSKWKDFLISEDGLKEFFDMLRQND